MLDFCFVFTKFNFGEKCPEVKFKNLYISCTIFVLVGGVPQARLASWLSLWSLWGGEGPHTPASGDRELPSVAWMVEKRTQVGLKIILNIHFQFDGDRHLALLRARQCTPNRFARSCSDMLRVKMADKPTPLMQSDSNVIETRSWSVIVLKTQ